MKPPNRDVMWLFLEQYEAKKTMCNISIWLMSPLGDSSVLFCFPLNDYLGHFIRLLLLGKLFGVHCYLLIIGTASAVGGCLRCWRQKQGRFICINMTALLPWQENNTHAGCVWFDLLFQAPCCLCSEQNLVLTVGFFSPHTRNIPRGPFKGHRGRAFSHQHRRKRDGYPVRLIYNESYNLST